MNDKLFFVQLKTKSQQVTESTIIRVLERFFEVWSSNMSKAIAY